MIGSSPRASCPTALNYQPGNPAIDGSGEDIVRAAEEYNEPGKFTAFIAYEWTSLVNGDNLHRNVIFRDGAETRAARLALHHHGPLGRTNPRDLWKWLRTTKRRPAARCSPSRTTATCRTA